MKPQCMVRTHNYPILWDNLYDFIIASKVGIQKKYFTEFTCRLVYFISEIQRFSCYHLILCICCKLLFLFKTDECKLQLQKIEMFFEFKAFLYYRDLQQFILDLLRHIFVKVELQI